MNRCSECGGEIPPLEKKCVPCTTEAVIDDLAAKAHRTAESTYMNQTADDWAHEQRMQLRDRYALAAMTGILANPDFERPETDGEFADGIFELADVMVERRGK